MYLEWMPRVVLLPSTPSHTFTLIFGAVARMSRTPVPTLPESPLRTICTSQPSFDMMRSLSATWVRVKAYIPIRILAGAAAQSTFSSTLTIVSVEGSLRGSTVDFGSILPSDSMRGKK